ncbi:hypothetical protein [Paenibacillus sp. NAIST15-1]|uniref:hypothetical protein n=1 Tax=Paenibacillus sp. NAIST15-1 TaxID=1605994 RepID=UPI00086EE3A9|nr:hypothetical protein [Paenibacillus sp. NAIST15-1]GAV11452.1 hypothetical protein PBN151_1381 [Paenibacillus sp. NAIST15-1]
MSRHRDTPSLKQGDAVVMHTCIEAMNPEYYGKIWYCKTDEFTTGKGVYKQQLVFLDGFSGSFLTEFLQKVNVNDETKHLTSEVERLKILYKDYLDMYTSTVSEKNKLKGKLQDALNTLERIVTMPYTLPDVCKDVAQLLSKETIQRIQEGK